MAEITRRRIGEIVRKVFEILSEAPDGLPVGEIASRAADEMVLTDFEKADYPNAPGVRRFEKMVRFATITPVKAGWLQKLGGTWRLTDEGRLAYQKFDDPEVFIHESNKGYKAWRAANPKDTEAGEDEELIEEDPGAFIERIRAEHCPPERIEFRRSAEGRAREFLDRLAGRMTKEQALELGRLFNADFRDKERRDRFKPAFHGATMGLLVENLETFNEWTGRLWDRDEERALSALDEVVSDSTAFPGAGRSYPTVLMYLRDPTRFAVWLPATTRGISALTGFKSGSRLGGRQAYLRFCDAVRDLSQNYGLDPAELDIVLTVAGRKAKRARAKTFMPLSGAMEFLEDLRSNNNRAWLDLNREVYAKQLFEPFSRLMDTVAGRYLRDLDPNLITEAKTGKVLAALRKRWPDESAEYNEYFWGAFSRKKKQEDVQLFVIVFPELLRYGLLLESADRELRDTLNAVLANDGQQLLDVIAPLRERLTFVLDGEKGTKVDPQTPEELAAWAAGEAPWVCEEIRRGDPLLDSPILVERIGSLLAGLHPLAAAAWGEAIRTPGPDEPRDPQEEYTMDRLVEDTLLPVEVLEEWIELLQQEGKRQAIFYGPPGTGKTHVARCLARRLTSDGGDVRMVQFHPAFSYEDFLEGLRPFSRPDGSIGYEIRPGVFLDFCEKARGSEGTFVFIIDEINRAEIGAVLGELMMLLEYRGETVQLPYSKKWFSIPSNVILLATMNTADRSLALVDFALRRRFNAIELLANRDVLGAFFESRGEEEPDLPLKFFDLVQQKVGDPLFAPGHTYWMIDDLTPADLDRVWRFQIKPYLAEFWFESKQQLVDLEAAVEVLLTEGE